MRQWSLLSAVLVAAIAGCSGSDPAPVDTSGGAGGTPSYGGGTGTATAPSSGGAGNDGGTTSSTGDAARPSDAATTTQGGGGGGDGAVPNPGGDAGAGASVTWEKACWYVDQGHRYQAIQFTLRTQTPLPLEGTLYFTTTCSASAGTDNLNDNGMTVGSGSWTYWFIHHPDETSTSAIWSIGGSNTGCVDYSHAPDCP